jgi:hypothetical protein
MLTTFSRKDGEKEEMRQRRYSLSLSPFTERGWLREQKRAKRVRGN